MVYAECSFQHYYAHHILLSIIGDVNGKQLQMVDSECYNSAMYNVFAKLKSRYCDWSTKIILIRIWDL